jgi:tungstate transport system substrate-binding protein
VACAGAKDTDLILATTTSTQDSGLLDVLLPLFEEESGYEVKAIAVGSGAALAMARSGDADVLLVHSPAAEQELVDEGFGIDRTRIMYNDFVVVGPPSDPAGIRGLTSTAEALAAIAASGAPFLSRGDDSGTHAKERALWAIAGMEVPRGQGWYAETGQGMGATLTVAQESDAYTLTDRATWLSGADPDRLPILVEGDPDLFNVYHVITVNPDQFPDLDLNTAGAEAFRQFLVGEQAQEIIATFGADEFGQPLFVPYLEE